MYAHPILDRLIELVETLDIEEEFVIDFANTAREILADANDPASLSKKLLCNSVAYYHGVSSETEPGLVELAHEVATAVLCRE